MPEDEWVPSSFFLQISLAWKAKINQDKQPDKSSHMGWPAVCNQVKVKSCKNDDYSKIKVSFTEKKVLYFKESFIFQSKCCILLKKVLY